MYQKILTIIIPMYNSRAYIEKCLDSFLLEESVMEQLEIIVVNDGSTDGCEVLVFDLDGTLFDTGEINYCSYREALQPYGIQLDHTYFVEQCNGRHYTEFLPSLMKTDRYLEEVHAARKGCIQTEPG